MDDLLRQSNVSVETVIAVKTIKDHQQKLAWRVVK